jgi:hypothetical protein
MIDMLDNVYRPLIETVSHRSDLADQSALAINHT